MLIADKLALNSGRADLEAVGVVDRVENVKRLVDGARHGFAVVDIDAAVLVDKDAQVPLSALLDVAHVPETKAELSDNGLAKLPYL